MEIFNRKLNMIKITGPLILLFLVKHGNADSTTTVTGTITNSNSTVKASPVTPSSTENEDSSVLSACKNTSGVGFTKTLTTKIGHATELSTNMSSPSPSPKTTKQPTVPTTTPPPPTTTKTPDKCYVFSCTNATCIVNENKTVNFPSNVQNCTRANAGYCYVDKTVNANTVTFTMGCNTTCQNKADILGCCDSNLCNGDLSLLLKSEGQFVNYNLLLSMLCIAISLF